MMQNKRMSISTVVLVATIIGGSLVLHAIVYADGETDEYAAADESSRVADPLDIDRLPPSPRQLAEQRRRERVWETQWERFASSFQRVGEAYYYVPNFHEGATNSRGLSERDLRDSMRVDYVPNPNRVTNRVQGLTVNTPDQDIHVAMRALPALEIGAFGYIHSCRVVERISDSEAVVTDIRLLDERALEAELRETEALVNREVGQLPGLRTDPRRVVRFMFKHRDEVLQFQEQIAEQEVHLMLRGFDEGHRGENAHTIPHAGGTWLGPIHVAIVAEEDGRLVAMPPGIFEPVETQEQFLDVLTQGQLHKEAFVDMFSQLAQQRISMSQIELRIGHRIAGLTQGIGQEIDLSETFGDRE